MFTSLDLLIIVFMALAAVTLLSLALMFLIRNKTARKVFKETELEAAEVFLERMGLRGAPEDWSGIWTMTSK